MGELQVNPQIVKPGIQIDLGKADFVSTLRTKPGSLQFKEMLP